MNKKETHLYPCSNCSEVFDRSQKIGKNKNLCNSCDKSDTPKNKIK
jgi:DNA-directed RNA polymerase subunit RPC12/RpoP